MLCRIVGAIVFLCLMSLLKKPAGGGTDEVEAADLELGVFLFLSVVFPCLVEIGPFALGENLSV